MIRLIPNPVFKATVHFTQPGTDELATVVFEFRHKPPKALDAWLQASKDKSSAAAMSEAIVGWSGVIDENGNEVPFSEDMLAAFMAGHGPRAQELISAYMREMLESRRKN